MNIDSFGFRYWDIDNNYTEFVNPIAIPLRDYLKQKDTNKVLSYLKDNNLSVDTEIKDGTTPIMYSSFYNDINTTNELIKLGADVHKKDKYGLNPMVYAIENNSTKIVKILFDNGVKFEEVEVIQGYLEPPSYGGIKSLTINNDNITIEYGSYWKVFDGPKTGQSPFSYVVNRNFIEIANFMLENGYRPKAYFTFGYDSKSTDNFSDIFSLEEEKQYKEWSSGFSRYDYTNYKALEYIPNHEPMLNLLLEHNISGQPSKEFLKSEYKKCYEFYYEFYKTHWIDGDKINKKRPFHVSLPIKLVEKSCSDKNGTFSNIKEFINYSNKQKLMNEIINLSDTNKVIFKNPTDTIYNEINTINGKNFIE